MHHVEATKRLLLRLRSFDVWNAQGCSKATLCHAWRLVTGYAISERMFLALVADVDLAAGKRLLLLSITVSIPQHAARK